jgi:ubiquinone/menaquinone biosynthesis C-methylase UbiE
MKTGSYHVENEGRSPAQELARLDQQGQLGWLQEWEVLRWNGLDAARRVLDAGCGTGVVAGQLLRQLPNAQLLLLDANANLLAQARQRLAAQAPARWEAHLGSVYEPPFAPAGFDFILSRYVFQHLDDPAAAMRALAGQLSEGGRLAVTEIDAGLWGIVEPQAAGLDAIYRQYAEVQARRGGDRLIGRKLYRLMQAAGLVNVRHYTFSYHSDEYGLAPFLPQIHPDRFLPLLTTGRITAEEFARLQAAFIRFVENPAAYILMTGMLVVGEKPHLKPE